MQLTFVAAVNDDNLLAVNLLASPCIKSGQYKLNIKRGCSSAAEAYNAGLDEADSDADVVVFLHQDVFLPDGWDQQFIQRWNEAANRFGKVDVAGVYGVGGARAGKIINYGWPLFEPTELPYQVRSIDELLVALPRSSPLRFDPALKFHFYGADIAQQAEVAVVLDVVTHHNSRPKITPGVVTCWNDIYPPEFHTSKAIFAAKWRDRLPIHTSCCEVR